ncbi:MAG: hypothetical protein ACP5ER_06605 [Candidatus Bathyarchaeales archaeon]
MRKTFLVVLKVIGETLFVYGLLGWIYGVLVQLFFPSWLCFGLSHLTPWIRIDTFAVISFIISIAGFFTSRLCKQLIPRT